MHESHQRFTKKRKLDDSHPHISQIRNTKATTFLFDANLSLQTPPPPTCESQRSFLDIKFAQVYFYDTRTTLPNNSPRFINRPELMIPRGMGLDLDLNLPCGSVRKNTTTTSCNELQNFGDLINTSCKDDEKKMDGLQHSPWWLTFEADQKEMVTAVCQKCHMLVMMCKSSPACPNCKFMHPPDQNLPTLFTPKVKPLVANSI